MKRLLRLAALGLMVLGVSPSATPPARACGIDYEILTRTVTHPDLPLAPFAAGQLGIIRPTWARSYLVVAYRQLESIGMNDAEQRSAIELWETRQSPWQRPDEALRRWQAARQDVVGEAGAPLRTDVIVDHAHVENCLADAFVHAEATLRERIARHGAHSSTARRFVEGQDAAFANCGGGPVSIPAALPDGTALEHADRAYHAAAARMYAMQHDEAARGFEAIAADASSPWRTLARYLVARTLVRKATLVSEDEAKPALEDALRQLDALIADPAAASVHAAAHRLQDRARLLVDPQAQLQRLAGELARERLDDALGRKLGDYTDLVDRHGLPADPLSNWIAIVQSGDPKAFDRALAQYRSTAAPVWLVAALVTAPDDLADADSLLDADVPATSPGFATVRFHQARLLAARGDHPRAYALVDDTVETLGAALPASARAAFEDLALASASTPEQVLAHVVGRPAAVRTEAVAAPSDLPEGFHPAGAAYLSSLPLSVSAKMVERDALPDAVAPRFAAATWIRAELLGRTEVADRLRPRVVATNPEVADAVRGFSTAKSPAARRLALVHLILTAPSASPMLRDWDAGPLRPGPIDTMYGDYFWCGVPTEPAAHWLSKSQREQAIRELAAFADVGPNVLAAEAVRLAEALPEDPRIPEVLHLAVRATRFGCRNSETTQRSAAAFRHLHRHYPDSPYTANTPYHY